MGALKLNQENLEVLATSPVQPPIVRDLARKVLHQRELLGGSESMHAESRLERQVRDLTAENKRLKMRIAELESTAGS
jgi:hypothetical protein